MDFGRIPRIAALRRGEQGGCGSGQGIKGIFWPKLSSTECPPVRVCKAVEIGRAPQRL